MEGPVQNPGPGQPQQQPPQQQQQLHHQTLSLQQQHLLMNLSAAPKRTISGNIRNRTASASALPSASGSSGPLGMPAPLHPAAGPAPHYLPHHSQLQLAGPTHPPPDALPHIQALRRFDLDLVLAWLQLDRQLAAIAPDPHPWPYDPYSTAPLLSQNAAPLIGQPQPGLVGHPFPAQTRAAAGSVSSTAPGGARPAQGSKTEPEKRTQRYVCTSCEVRFTRRWDWKHHEETVHERWRKFPCPDCNQEFWSENSFNQHHKSAHNCKNCPHASSVKKDLRKRSGWGCGFCAGVHYAWDDRCKHVATHFDKGQTKDDWKHSNVIYGLLHQPDLLDAWQSLLVHKHGDNPQTRPRFRWRSKTTGRLQGLRDGSGERQLQDLLEYPRSADEVADIVKTAYELGLTTEPDEPAKDGSEPAPAVMLERRDSIYPLELAKSPSLAPVPAPAAPATSTTTAPAPAPTGQTSTSGSAAMPERALKAAKQTSQQASPMSMSYPLRYPPQPPQQMHVSAAHHSHSHSHSHSRSHSQLAPMPQYVSQPVNVPMMVKTESPGNEMSGMLVSPLSTQDRFELGQAGSGPLLFSNPLTQPGPGFGPAGPGSGSEFDFDFGDPPVGSSEFLATPTMFAAGPDGLGLGASHANVSSLSLPASLEHNQRAGSVAMTGSPGSPWQGALGAGVSSASSTGPAHRSAFFQFSQSPAFAPGVESLIALEKELPVLGADEGVIPDGFTAEEWMTAMGGAGPSGGGFSSSPHSVDGYLSSH